jgi:superkiller protein 3
MHTNEISIKLLLLVIGDYRSNKQYAYSQFIQAAQLELSDAFTYLGHYYRLVEADEPRSIKCYQKAYTMNPEDLEASQYLTAYLLTSKQVDAAEALLRQLTRLSLRASWIWRRLGMLELVNTNIV